MRILVIDDNSNDRLLVRREILRDHGAAEIVEIESRQQFEEALADLHIDLAIIDYSLGWAEGLSIFRQVRAVDGDCGAIMYTGTLGEDYAVEAMKAGLDDYIIKDIARLPRLRASIRALLSQRSDRQALRRAEARYRDLFRNVTVGLFACAPDGTFEDGNPALLAMLGVEGVEGLRRLNLLEMIHCKDARQRWASIWPAGVAKLESALMRPDGVAMWVLIDAHMSADCASGAIEGVLTDVTALKAALEQKTVLLKEVFHRVNNNLQLVDALLSLEERRTSDAAVREGFRDISGRIRSLSLIQQKLYKGNDFTCIDFGGYLRELTAALLQLPRRPEITARVDVDPLHLAIEKATPLGLMANELITNALKYAFPPGRSGEIAVTLRREADGQAAMTICDDGIGEAPPAIPVGAGFGSHLLALLAKQADARMEIDRTAGFATTIRFRS